MVGGHMMHWLYMDTTINKVKHSENEFTWEDGAHMNGVELYWPWTKRRLAQVNALTTIQFREYMLESEWSFNHRKSLKLDLKRLIKKVR
jgi:transposase-like protein